MACLGFVGGRAWQSLIAVAPDADSSCPHASEDRKGRADQVFDQDTDYRTRASDIGMAAPRVTVVTPGSFHRWLVGRDQLGDQHKMPRASNQRDVIEAVLRATGARELSARAATR